MTDLYLVRHGETEWSRDGRHTSVTDLPLTSEGEAQARALRGHLRPGDFGLVLASPRMRARTTAALAGFGEADTVVTDDLAEWSYGEYEGLTRADIRTRDPEWTVWDGVTPGGESPAAVTERLRRVVDRVRGSGVDRAICFGHGHALRALTMVWLGFDVRLGEHFPLDTSTVSVLGDDRGEPALERWNARP